MSRQGSSDTRADMRGYLRIDRDDLDAAIAEQPELYEHVGEQLALATATRDAAKVDLEEAQARGDQAIRHDAEEAGEKMTEARIERELKLRTEVQDARRRLSAAQSEVEAWAALKESFQQRSYMLREMAGLWSARILAGTSMSSNKQLAQDRAVDDVRHSTAVERRRRRSSAQDGG